MYNQKKTLGNRKDTTSNKEVQLREKKQYCSRKKRKKPCPLPSDPLDCKKKRN